MFESESVGDVESGDSYFHFAILFQEQLQRIVFVNKRESLILRAANQSVGWDLNHCQWKESVFIITKIPRVHN